VQWILDSIIPNSETANDLHRYRDRQQLAKDRASLACRVSYTVLMVKRANCPSKNVPQVLQKGRRKRARASVWVGWCNFGDQRTPRPNEITGTRDRGVVYYTVIGRLHFTKWAFCSIFTLTDRLRTLWVHVHTFFSSLPPICTGT